MPAGRVRHEASVPGVGLGVGALLGVFVGVRVGEAVDVEVIEGGAVGDGVRVAEGEAPRESVGEGVALREGLGLGGTQAAPVPGERTRMRP